MSSDPKTPVAVEDLLRLKRCEVPPAEFWNDFDRELRSKQLAAIVERRPWWARFSRTLQVFARYRVPMGAAAALAASVAGFHEYRIVALRSSAEGLAGGDIPAATVAGPEARLAAVSTDSDGIERQIIPEAAGRPHVATVAYREPVGPSSLRPWIVTRSELQSGDISPSERSIEANLAAVEASQPEILRHVLSLSQRFDSQLVPENRHVAEPLAQISSISQDHQDRRARLLAEVVATSDSPSVAPAPTSDQVLRSLSDDRINDDAISRYRVGDSDLPSLSIRF